jgi:hypothetical protein
MSVITIFSGSFCSADAVIGDVIESTGYRKIDDNRVVDRAAALSGIPESKIRRAFSSRNVGVQQIHPRKGMLRGLPAAGPGRIFGGGTGGGPRLLQPAHPPDHQPCAACLPDRRYALPHRTGRRHPGTGGKGGAGTDPCQRCGLRRLDPIPGQRSTTRGTQTCTISSCP